MFVLSNQETKSNKMELHKFTGVGAGNFEVDKPSAGLNIYNVAKDAKIRVDRVSDKDGEKNVFPEMTIEEYVSLFGGVADRPTMAVINEENTAYEMATIPFSFTGVLPLDEDIRYRVALTGMNNRTTVFHNIDSTSISAAPIRVRLSEIKATLQDDIEQIGTTDFLFFPNGLPNKMEYFVAEQKNGKEEKRKVVISQEQIELYDRERRITQYQNTADGKVFEVGNKYKSYPVTMMPEVTIHKAEGEEYRFYHVDVN